MTHESSKLSKFHKEQISHLRQAIFSLETAKSSVLYAIGGSDIGSGIANCVESCIADLEEKINDIWDSYD